MDYPKGGGHVLGEVGSEMGNVCNDTYLRVVVFDMKWHIITLVILEVRG